MATIGKRIVVLGAGASRDVSYAREVDFESPLDADFFDLLQRKSVRPDAEADTASERDVDAIKRVLQRVKHLPSEHWRSMERAFYTMHLKSYLQEKLGLTDKDATEQLLADFARSVQALLREAHNVFVCDSHRRLLRGIGKADCIVSFNYDLVVERALRGKLEKKGGDFGPWIYGLADRPTAYQGPLLLKLHGSSNWKVLSADEDDSDFEVRTNSWSDLDQSPGYRGHLGKGTRYPIFLPFWDKRVERGAWLQLWKKAYTVLSHATHMVIWGYSLPPTDVKTQHLFSLALAEKENFNMCVIDPSPQTRMRWRDLFKNALYWEYNSISDFLDHPPKWWRPKKTDSP